jgi:amino acid adenylation domain-containing protein
VLVSDFLEQSADRFPDKVALVCGERRLTYREVEDRANRTAHALKDLGLARQDRAAVFLDPTAEAVICLFGILKADGVFIMINPQVKAHKAAYILNDCQVKVLVTDAVRLKEVAAVLKECPHLEAIVLTDHDKARKSGVLEKAAQSIPHDKFMSYEDIQKADRSNAAGRPKKHNIDIDLAALIYTSGSTGRAKGVMLTHLNMVAAASSIITYLENTPNDIILDALPLSFDYGLYQVLMAFKFGGTVILERTFLYPYKIIDLIMKEKVTGFPVVPTMAAILLRLRHLERYDFSSLRYITNTAQALPPQHIAQMRKVFSGTKIYSMYGLTECKRVSFLAPEELERRPASVGKAMPNTEAYIVDDNGNKVMEPGVVGELVVRGANVMKGYWNLPEETAGVLKTGPQPGEKVLHTGDLFKMDEDGFLYFVSRMDDMLKVAGERVSPKEVENVLHEIEGIAEAAVVGVDDEITGQAIKAFVVLDEGSAGGTELSERDIIKLCSRSMENFMIPKYVEIRDELPRSEHGKVDKKALTAGSKK